LLIISIMFPEVHWSSLEVTILHGKPFDAREHSKAVSGNPNVTSRRRYRIPTC
jgi:hypothetical protein